MPRRRGAASFLEGVVDTRVSLGEDLAVLLRAVAALAIQVAFGLSLGVIVAALWGLARGGSFLHALAVGCWVIGGLCLLLAAGNQSPSRRDYTSTGWMAKWASTGTFALNRGNPGDNTLATGALFVLVGLALVGIGILIDAL